MHPIIRLWRVCDRIVKRKGVVWGREKKKEWNDGVRRKLDKERQLYGERERERERKKEIMKWRKDINKERETELYGERKRKKER